MNRRIVSIFILITIIISSCLVSAVPQNIQTDDSQKASSELGRKVKIFHRVWASGLATSGKKLNPLGLVGVIRFSYLKFDRLNFIPLRGEMVDFIGATAILFGVNQHIPIIGPFIFRKERIPLAIVFT